jgi:energy-converting hydrogenase Eha subunit A
MCASVTVQKPRRKSIETNSSSSDRPVITSGITSGA